MDINQLRKSRSMDFSKITSALSKSTDAGYNKDEDSFFNLTKDKAGNGSAVIRFLPTAAGDELPWIQMYSHAFKGPTGKWYIENCLSTLGEADPVNEYNRVLWQGNDKDKEQARQQKRKLQYVANVYIVSDPGNRENEGKVMMFKFGKKIFEKITEKLQPTFEDEKPINVFDVWEGANFKLRVRQYEGYPNYDQSTFGEIGPLAEDDDAIDKILGDQKPLKDIIAPSKFKPYAELKKKMDSVLSNAAMQPQNDEPVIEAKATKTVEAKVAKSSKAVETVPAEDEDDLENFFKSIA